MDNFRRLELQREILSWGKNIPQGVSAEELSSRFDLQLKDVLKISKGLGFQIPGYNDLMSEEITHLPKIGRYQPIRVLGEGGMGIVYLAFDPKLNRKIAIKVLRTDQSTNSTATKAAQSRLYREAQAMAQVSNHQNIVTIFDVGTHDSQIYLAMEYVDGPTLKEWTHKNASNWEDVRDMYLQAACGLDAAHQKNLIHRDFKPDNCLVSQDGTVKVMDFGLARREGHRSGMTQMIDTTAGIDQFKVELTQTGIVQGTPAYMAPEQFNQEPTSARTDQFAYCVALFEALAGYRPFHATDYETLQLRVTKGELVDPPSKSPVPSWIWEAILKGLSRFPEYRWKRLLDLSGALVEPPPHILFKKRTRIRRIIGLSLSLLMTVGIFYRSKFGYFLQKPEAVIAPQVKSDLPRGIRLSYRSTMGKDEIHWVIDQHWHMIDHCFRIWRTHRAPPNDVERTLRVRIQFVIRNRTPTQFRIDGYPESTVGNAATSVGACIIGTAGQIWKFPPNFEDITVSYPFISFP